MPKNLFQYWYDPAHGWLEVTKSDLEDVGLKPTDFSAFSYKKSNGEVFYLEEDCDADKFFKAYKAKFGYEPKLRETHIRSTQPSYNHIRRCRSILD